eukprot:TCALIF_04523-PA protein Name:"Similar to asun Protein asunder homolog (Xenopus tropicalis)" AED:0.24 eAED:0.24 QI:0/0.5/0/1/1/1/3/0/611
MAFPMNHKTIFVMDHHPNFSMACDQIEFDFHKARTPNAGYIPAPPVTKTMWTCATEAVMEYCRIVWDIFPTNKLIQFIVGNQEGKVINSWDSGDQNSRAIANGFASCGRPESESKKKAASNKSYSLLRALFKAIESLTELTDTQKRVQIKHVEDGGPKLVNRGRIVCITHMHDDKKLNQLVASFKEELSALNQKAAGSDTLVPINEVTLEVAEVHEKLLHHGSELVQAMKEGSDYKTVTLKWCTPRGSTADLHFCTQTVRITPTDVNSRPSSCLTNFLLKGRSVMLEMPKKSGSKTLSHMLTSHGGEIFIHTLSISRSILEDPPSISEGPGGRVTDYRIPDLCEIMKANRVAPWPGNNLQAVEKSRARLSRFVQVCPLTISSTTIFNMAVLEPMQRIIVQEELTDEDEAECRKAIYTLISMENKADPLPVPTVTSVHGKVKTLKKDEQYKMMFTELEKFLLSHARTERHNNVLNCLLECRNKPIMDHAQGTTGNKDDQVEVEVALAEIERYQAMTERERSDFNMSSDGVLRATTESPMSPNSASTPAGPPPSKKIKSMFRGGKSLLDIWTNKVEKEHSKYHVPFAGTLAFGEKASLYVKVDKDGAESGNKM